MSVVEKTFKSRVVVELKKFKYIVGSIVLAEIKILKLDNDSFGNQVEVFTVDEYGERQ